MVARIGHVAIAVADLQSAIDHLRNAWGLEVTARATVRDQGVEEALLPIGESALQLIAPLEPDSSIARFIARRGEGLHHVAVEVPDVQAELDRLKEHGVALIDDRPRPGAGGDLIAFVHPKGNLGLLVELIQRPATDERSVDPRPAR
jgi:methylmalonyl-CoA/ethylmalonyl-CoA epimerase